MKNVIKWDVWSFLFLQSQVGKLNEIDRLTKQVENAAA